MKPVTKTVNLQLVGLSNNAFALLGAFRRQAKREGWLEAEIKSVLKSATSGDYDNLLCVLSAHCKPTQD